ncbi:histidine kinase [Tumebacillus avium]|uniref:Histidine kinase n=1 Tax=Tumebacillus avium TaxID=1903704 RepID=A0A1Y0IHX0_9BACL|nr:DICT sensory domain-containing protein [Tumebacillus avium]ARU60102.1 histidine kinase [Tumebacillus avium]
MKELSLFEELFQSVEGNTEKLSGMLSRAALDVPSLKYETRVPQLEYMCLIMENMVLTKKPRARIYAGFQKLSRAVDPVLERFFQMAEFCEGVTIFGENDKAMPKHDGVEYISLPPRHKLTREWFLVVQAPTMKQMMVAYDMDGFGKLEVEEERNFKGVKSIHPAVVDRAAALLEELAQSRLTV